MAGGVGVWRWGGALCYCVVHHGRKAPARANPKAAMPRLGMARLFDRWRVWLVRLKAGIPGTRLLGNGQRRLAVVGEGGRWRKERLPVGSGLAL